MRSCCRHRPRRWSGSCGTVTRVGAARSGRAPANAYWPSTPRVVAPSTWSAVWRAWPLPPSRTDLRGGRAREPGSSGPRSAPVERGVRSAQDRRVRSHSGHRSRWPGFSLLRARSRHVRSRRPRRGREWVRHLDHGAGGRPADRPLPVLPADDRGLPEQWRGLCGRPGEPRRISSADGGGGSDDRLCTERRRRHLGPAWER